MLPIPVQTRQLVRLRGPERLLARINTTYRGLGRLAELRVSHALPHRLSEWAKLLSKLVDGSSDLRSLERGYVYHLHPQFIALCPGDGEGNGVVARVLAERECEF